MFAFWKGDIMQEKRKSKRFVLEALIAMKRIDGKKEKLVPITVVDVSRTGIGFECGELLEMNSVYNVELKIWTGDVIDTFINIVRFDNSKGKNLYGGIFIGMTEKEACKFDIYELFEEARQNQR